MKRGLQVVGTFDVIRSHHIPYNLLWVFSTSSQLDVVSFFQLSRAQLLNSFTINACSIGASILQVPLMGLLKGKCMSITGLDAPHDI